MTNPEQTGRTITLSDGMKWTKLTEIEGRHWCGEQHGRKYFVSAPFSNSGFTPSDYRAIADVLEPLAPTPVLTDAEISHLSDVGNGAATRAHGRNTSLLDCQLAIGREIEQAVLAKVRGQDIATYRDREYPET